MGLGTVLKKGLQMKGGFKLQIHVHITHVCEKRSVSG